MLGQKKKEIAENKKTLNTLNTILETYEHLSESEKRIFGYITVNLERQISLDELAIASLQYA